MSWPGIGWSAGSLQGSKGINVFPMLHPTLQRWGVGMAL